ncbi:tetratricopeptide repeat protein [Nocardioides mangrovicus]|uniref:Tetratricopeptide repeat protein n=1 Tax=Nocardioides mangrovicus TaxID=2478913 RepID=A0A3L8P7C9_9ACTN|nr:tetratricopeptide repeat protein [Nocardioides mangrovicus]RLV50288.1 tetratricopeptide repeat protein [Nocardioides mangrovicus]
MPENQRGGRGDRPRSNDQRSGGNRSGGNRAGDKRGGERRGEQRSSGKGRGSSGGNGGGGGRRGDWRGRAERDRTPTPRSVEQERYDGPPIPEQVTGKELDRSVRAQLASLPEKLGERVARHLVAAGLLLEDDPATAYQHTLAARARAGRLAVVREAVGEAAYASGEFAEALTELRAARRMNGAKDYLAMMADCERALGRPDRALELLRGVDRDGLPAELKAELTIVEAGARRDRGELDAALRTLEQAPLMTQTRATWVARLRYAYADILLAADRRQDALTWFHRTEAVDAEEATDAADRAAELERSLEG